MDGNTKRCLTLLAKILILFIQEGKVIPNDYMTLIEIANENWRNVEK